MRTWNEKGLIVSSLLFAFFILFYFILFYFILFYFCNDISNDTSNEEKMKNTENAMDLNKI